MIRQTEKWFIRKINKVNRGSFTDYEKQYVRRTTFWLLWIIPIFTKDEVVKGQYEN